MTSSPSSATTGRGKGGSLREAWHQKVHNNTTADDGVIGRAFLAGWAAPPGGDRGAAFWAAIAAGGLSAARLAA